MKLVDMKRTKADKKKSEKEMKNVSSIGGEEHPYGLRIHLGEEELSKLGMDNLPSVGDKLHIMAHGRVHSVSSDHHSSGRKSRRVEIQLHKLGVGHGGSEQEQSEGKLRGAKAAIDKALDAEE